MSHLGELLSALVDSELSGAELDRASAHLAACGTCQAEAAELRRLKQELRALGTACASDGIASRLLGITGTDGTTGTTGGDGLPGPVPGRAPAGRAASGSGQARRRRGRYVLLGTVSLVVAGIGSAAFGMGGGSAAPGPRVTPQVEVFDVEHAITSGDVPFTDPAGRSGRTPAAAARP